MGPAAHGEAVIADLCDRAADAFRTAFGREPACTRVAPGRVNLLGGHVDYNEGLVLPVAVDFGLGAAGAPREDGTVRLRSANLDGEITFRLDEIHTAGNWGDYPKGVIRAHRDRGDPVGGFDAFFAGDVPIGGGVSSSAAVDVVTSALVQGLFAFSVSGPEVARLSQEADNTFVGVRCGIMDQFVSAMGRAGHLLALDCRTLEYEHVPIDLDAYCIVLMPSGVPRRIVDSEYNARRAECERGVALLRERYPDARALRDITPAMLEDGRDALPDTTYKRCRHVVEEIARVEAGIAALRAGRVREFGALMYASHAGSRDWYEVSCPELDVLVAAAEGAPGSVGARVTGAGFGGCTVHLVEGDAVSAFTAQVCDAFEAEFGRRPEPLVCQSADGAFVHAQ